MPGKSPQAGDKPVHPESPSSDGKPTNPGADPKGASINTAGEPPSKAKTARVSVANPAERWGELPIQVREVFRNEGGADMPPQYRDWIDAYYRKLLRVE
ncbi:MAG TPA: hypothetical protein VK843_19500 [Planctomycetota bacterium]|nr:hypothetical protein [Planctomycetota bacterium]